MAFWKPGTSGPAVLIERETEREAEVPVFNPDERLTLSQQRVRLPIYQSRNHLLYLVEKYQVVILVGQTGCGKTTPGWSGGGYCIACTQPRRIAATSVAARVATEMGVMLGQEVYWHECTDLTLQVGYAVRFDDYSDPAKTRIKYMTDGMLVREMMLDPLLSTYSVVMLDEAHERSLHTDVLLGLLKKVLKRRPDLHLIVSSATLDAEQFRDFFNTNTSGNLAQDTSVVISVEGRQYPVELHYLEEPTMDYLQCAVDTVLDIHETEPPGDILVFLTGAEEIETAAELIRDRSASTRVHMKLLPLPIYAGLPADEQLRVFEQPPANTRKVIVATNIAETSITISGIVYVIDCGFVKMRAYNPRSGREALIVVPISQSSANQRSGRAGRIKPGKCYRLFTEKAFHNDLPKFTPPEIQRTNLANVVLQLKAMGIDNIMGFEFMSPPPPEMMLRALELLYALKALDDSCKLTPVIGTQMAEFPTDPMLTRMLLASAEFKCSEEILSIAAMLSVQSVWTTKEFRGRPDIQRKKLGAKEGDHLTLLNVYNAFRALKPDQVHTWCQQYYISHRALTRAVEIRKQLYKYLRKFDHPILSSDDSTVIRKAIVAGFFANAVQLTADGSYRTMRDDKALHLHPSSILFKEKPPEWLIFHEVVETTKEFMREVTVVEPIWLFELAPHYYNWSGPPPPSAPPAAASKPAATAETRPAKQARN